MQRFGIQIHTLSVRLAFGALALLSLPCSIAAAQTVQFISAPNRVDTVYDDTRGLLYITSGSQILRYQLSSNSFLSPISVGGSLEGIDISPDESTIAVADETFDNVNNTNAIHLVNLDTLGVTTVNFPLQDLEGGTFTVAYGGDGNILVSSLFEGSGGDVPLWLYNPVKNTQTNAGSVLQNTMLQTSANGKVTALAEGDNSGGPFASYTFKKGVLNQGGGTGWFNYEIGVNSKATIYAIPTYGGTWIADKNLHLTGTVIGTYAGQQPVAAAFHPKKPLVYFPFAQTTNVEVYSTKTWTEVTSYNFGSTFGSNGNYAFVNGRTKLSKDGSLLFVTVANGVGYVSTTK
jgi:hypothetical protein